MLSELMVNEFDAVPAIVVDAAERLLTFMLSKYPLPQ